jgi:ubiquinone/menaquinone biosynthesis C-methylase UbiE
VALTAAGRSSCIAPGDSVLDIACGTGANFALLDERVGPAGRVVGVDLSPDMLAVAAERVRRTGSDNLTLIEAGVEDAELPGEFEGALFALAHDVLQSKPALDNVFAHVRRAGGSPPSERSGRRVGMCR